MMSNILKDAFKIQSQKTNKEYTVVCAEEASLNEAAVNQITEVCDEPEIYDNIFSSIFKGKRYTKENAKFFVNLMSEGVASQNRFDWLILYDEQIVGTIGIKNLDGEIGYWQSNKHPGVMTEVAIKVCSLAKIAGFKSLHAYVDKTNIPSVKVLKRAGFEIDSKLEGIDDETLGYKVSL
jgi:RimJ/RimL family protein N-acetyltransferase